MTPEEKTKSDNNIKYIFDGIAPAIKELGLNVEIQTKELDGAGYLDSNRILITHPTLDLFKAEILGREWSDTDRATLFCKTEHTRSIESRPYSDGSKSSTTHKYNFEYMINDSDLEAIGIPKQDYRRKLNCLRVGFKATKNIKLILRDILPSLKMYLEVVKLASEEVVKRIEKEDRVFKLQVEVNKYDKYHHKLYDFGAREFDTTIGRVNISEGGDITITQKIEPDALLALLKKAPKHKN